MSKKPHNRLGQKAIIDLGLSELLSECDPSDTGEQKKDHLRITMISPERLIPNPFQQRRVFNDDAIDELAKTIEDQGVLQPLVVRASGIKYEIIAGERRWRAAKKVGLEEVPVVIKSMTDHQAMLIGLIENLQREDLNIIDQAMGIHSLITDFSMTHVEISKKIGMSRQSVTNILRILQLHQDVHDAIRAGKLHFGHARCLVTLPAKEQVRSMHKVIENKWSVRQLELWLANKKNKPAQTTSQNSLLLSEKTQLYVSKLEQAAISHNSKIQISAYKKRVGGKLTIEFKNSHDLEKIFENLGERLPVIK